MLSAIQIPERDPLVGALLDGRYHVTGVLGRGGMGIVYEGLHQPLGRAVAIKVLGHNTASDPVVVARFLREARVASGLAHGNIVDVSDLGRLPDGRPYLVMPKVAGIDFATLMEREGPMAPGRVANLLRGVAAALDLVHAKGLVHRDVKPENLMHVLRADGSETVMLLDFGIAALLPGNAVRLTADDMMCGSPAYMAPELIATGTFDRRADVYALATVAFELLAGCLPFDDELPMRVMMTKTSSAAPSLNEVSETSETNEAPFSEDVERVIARGLAREPSQRYSSAGEFVAQLALAAGDVAGAGDFAHDASSVGSSSAAHVDRADAVAFESTRPTESVVTQNTRRAASLVAIAVAAAVGVLFAWWLAPRAGIVPNASAPRSATRATVRDEHRELENAGDEASTAQETQETQEAQETQESQETQEARSAERVDLPQATQAQAEDVRAEGVQATAARETAHAPRKPRALAPRRIAKNVAANDMTPRDPSAVGGDPAEGLTLAANRELLQGHLARSVELFERAIQRDPHDLVALRGLGLANERLGRSADAVRAYRLALALEPNASLAPKLRERLERLGASP